MKPAIKNGVISVKKNDMKAVIDFSEASRKKILIKSALPSTKPEDRITASKRTNKKTLTEFTVFSKLPVELRNMIWTIHCSTSGRIVEPKVILVKFASNPVIYPRWVFRTKLPSVLLVNREARTEGLRSYRLSFTTSFPPINDGERKFNSAIYYNDFADTLYITRETIRELGDPVKMIPNDMKTVRSVAVDIMTLKGKGNRSLGLNFWANGFMSNWTFMDVHEFMKSFTHLERLSLIYHGRDNNTREELFQHVKKSSSTLAESDDTLRPRVPPEISLISK